MLVIGFIAGMTYRNPFNLLSAAQQELQDYCQTVVQRNYQRSYTYLSDKDTLISRVGEFQFITNVKHEAGSLGFRSCNSTVALSGVTDKGWPYAQGVVLFTYQNGTVIFHQYGLFQDGATHTWHIDTSYWRNPVSF
jgi:hypothetical protein